MSLNLPSYFFMMVFFVDMNCDGYQGRALSDEKMGRTSGIFLTKAILNEECANPVIDYIPSAGFSLPRKPMNLICVVHRHGNTLPPEVIDIHNRWGRATLWGVHELQFSRSGGDEVCRPVLSRDVGTSTNREGTHVGWVGSTLTWSPKA